MFGIDAGEYMLSLCSDAALKLLNTPGKSGAFFFLTTDDQVRTLSLMRIPNMLLAGADRF